MLRVCLVGIVSLGLFACPKPAPVVDAGPAKKEPPPFSTTRPPFPNMATAAYGQRVFEERLNAAPSTTTTIAQVLDALHELQPGSEQRAADLATTAFRSAKTDGERANAVTLLAVALILDPVVEGYKERLTDAFGLANYAVTLDQSEAVAQAARALVGATAGAVDQSKRLVEMLATTPAPQPEARLFMAMTRRIVGDRSQAFFDDVDAAIAHRPTSQRAHALLAETYLEMGLIPEAIKTAKAELKTPWLDAIRGRALVLDGKLDQGVALLRDVDGKLDEGRRGDALYWLGRSLTQKEELLGEVPTIVASLSQRAGFAKEAKVLDALLAQRAGDYEKARTLLEPLARGPAGLPVDIDLTWLLVDACAGLGDAKCVEDFGKRALALDGDAGRLQTARAALALVGQAEVDVEATFREAHRLTPFDAQLAEKVKEPVVPGGQAAAARVRAARKALARKALPLVDVALAPLAKEPLCRVCRALRVASADGAGEGAARALAALAGKGPELGEVDLLRVIDALGAVPRDDTKKALAALASDARPEIKKAVALAQTDHKDPDARARRTKDEHGH